MSKPASFLQGTLDLLILKILDLEPRTGWAISQRLRQMSNETLQVSHGSLYPALHRLERDKLVSAEWKVTGNRRRARYYKLTPAGRKWLAKAEDSWDAMAKGVGRVLRFA